MTAKERLIGSHVLDANDAFRLQFLDTIHQQHRIAVGKDLPDRLDIHAWHAVSLL